MFMINLILGVLFGLFLIGLPFLVRPLREWIHIRRLLIIMRIISYITQLKQGKSLLLDDMGVIANDIDTFFSHSEACDFIMICNYLAIDADVTNITRLVEFANKTCKCYNLPITIE
jgi:hypothetical protein